MQAAASDALDIIEHGVNFQSQADMTKVMAVIAGGLSCIPGAGPILGAGMSLLMVGAVGIQSLADAIGLQQPPGCKSSGNATPAAALAQMRSMGIQSPPRASPALVVPMLAANVANMARNCQHGPDNGTVIQAAIALWNQHVSGPPEQPLLPLGLEEPLRELRLRAFRGAALRR